MTAVPAVGSPDPLVAELDLTAIRRSVDEVLDRFLARQARAAGPPVLPAVVGLIRDFLGGGKGIRPILCVVGWHAARVGAASASVVHLAASLELFHAFALIHDDVMDNSDTRRGRPTLHRVLAAHHHERLDTAAAKRFGANAAILLGDLALVWSDRLLRAGRLTEGQRDAVMPLLEDMRTELMLGQYLDLCGTGRVTDDVDAALAVIRAKTATCTVRRPLRMGAALAGDAPPILDACTAYGVPLGEAFRLRDDLLGVFADPASTGKSARDDLREGKATVLIAVTLRRATPDQSTQLRALAGNPDLDQRGADRMRAILTATGAPDAVEQMITDRHRTALATLDSAEFQPAAAAALRTLADTIIHRTA